MGSRSVGIAVALGGAIAVVGGLLIAAGAFRWFGHLPGDIRIEGERSRIYLPITSLLLISLTANLVIAVVRRFL